MMSRKLVIVLATIIGVLVLLVGGVQFLVKVLVTPDMVRKHFLPRVEQAIHRRVDMADVSIGLFTGIALEGLKVYEADGTTQFVALGEARLRFGFLPLLSRRVVIDEIVLVSPDIRIVRNADGSFNFSDLMRREKKEVAAGQEKMPFSFAVSSISVSDGRVQYIDRKGISGTPTAFEVREIDVEVSDFETDGQFPLELSAKVSGADFGFSGTVKGIAGGQSVDGQVELAVDDLAKTVAGLPPVISAKVRSLAPRGSVTAKLRVAGPVNEPRAMFKGGEVRLKKVKIAAGGLSPEFTGRIDIIDGALVSRDLVAVLGKDRVSLQLKSSSLDRKPFAATLNLNSDSLNFDAMFLSTKAPHATGTAMAAGSGTEPGPIKLSLSLNGAVNVKQVVLKGLVLSGVSLTYRLADNILTISDFKGGAAGGSFMDTARVNLGTRGFSYSTRLSLQNVQVSEIAAAFAPKAAGKMSGELSLKADVSGSGTKPAAIKRNLAGSGSFDVRNGKITGSGFANELARFLGSQELRIIRFSSYAGTFRINNGQVFLDSALNGSDIRMKPQGRIGLDKSLDIDLETRVAPRIAGTLVRGSVGSFLTDAQGWKVLPLKVAGTVDSPLFTLSGKAVGRQIGEKIGESIRKQLEKGTGADQNKTGPNVEQTIRGLFGK